MTEPAKLYVAFLWHMHQPFYKDFGTNKYILPWVRLHAIKDYYEMVLLLEKFPSVRVTFNLVPSLLTQLEDFSEGTSTDVFWDLTLIPAEELNEQARFLILRNFFYINWDNNVYIYPRYAELLNKRGKFVTDVELEKLSSKFSPQDFRDLQVWFNLAWFGQILKTTDPFLKDLIKKGKNFSEEDKKLLLEKQIEVMKNIVPKYKALQDKGQIEISVSPFYHPILPLILDIQSAKVSSPGTKLPEEDIYWPEDVREHLKMAKEYYQKIFNKNPEGLWPSEGAVSEAILPFVTEQGFKWLATDEEILVLSLGKAYSEKISGRPITAQELYRPYRIDVSGQDLVLFFRDHPLSDLIGFVYSRWEPKTAVEDFLNHLRRIKDALPPGKGYLVSVILDGENAWEYYPRNGLDFLTGLYEKLSNEPDIKTITFSDYLKHYSSFQKLEKLYPGSWINHNFRIWVGDEEDNTAWEYLARARKVVKGITMSASPDDTELQKKLSACWQEIFIAEGSDWYWWFGEDHSSAHDSEFDALFRRHLINIYHILNLDAPEYLNVPIKGAFKETRTSREPTFTIKPVIDGKVTSYYEWLSAGLYVVSGSRGTMHQSKTLVKEIYYGFDMQNLYLRVDFNEKVKDVCQKKGMVLSFSIFNTEEFKLDLSCSEEKPEPFILLYKKDSLGKWQKIEEIKSFAVGEIIEIQLPFEKVNAQRGEKLKFILIIEKDGHELERWPVGGFITCKVPEEDFEAEMWCV